MMNWKDKLKQSLTNEETQRYLKFLVIPFVVIILMIVIVIIDKPNKEGQAGTTAESGEETPASTDQETTEAEGQVDISGYTLQVDAVPEITALLQQYFQAKKDSDVDALNQVFGNTLEGDLEARRMELENEALLREDYQNVVCYTKPGKDADTYVVYGKFDMKFKGTDTLAPSLAVCYAIKGADGNYYFSYENAGSTADYINRMNKTEDVQQLATQVNQSLKTALESDAKLYAIYSQLTGTTETPAETAEAETTEAEVTEAQTTQAQTAEAESPADSESQPVEETSAQG